jgi:hypothetical protein
MRQYGDAVTGQLGQHHVPAEAGVATASLAPSTSSPPPPLQSWSVAVNLSPARRSRGTKRRAAGDVTKSSTTRHVASGALFGRPSGRATSRACTQASVSGASGPSPGGVKRCSALAFSSWTSSAGGRAAIWREVREEKRSKSPRLSARPHSSERIPTRKGITRWPAMSRTVQSPHKLGTRHCLSSSASNMSAARRRSWATREKTSSRSTWATLDRHSRGWLSDDHGGVASCACACACACVTDAGAGAWGDAPAGRLGAGGDQGHERAECAWWAPAGS